MGTSNTKCPGCGVILPVVNFDSNPRFNASPACWQLFTELSNYTIGLRDKEFNHQLVVDTYAVQHISQLASSIQTSFALIGLYLVFEKGLTGRNVQIAHGNLAKTKKDWPTFEPFAHSWPMTVQDVIQAPAGNQRGEALRLWAKNTWEQCKTDPNPIDISLIESLIGVDGKQGLTPRNGILLPSMLI